MSTTKRTFPITELPTTLRIEDAVESACAADIAFVEEKLQRGTSVLVECDKELTFFLYLAVRARFRRNRESPKLIVIDGRPAPDQPSRGNLPRMMEQLTEAIRGAIDKTVIVVPHLDVLTTTHTGLTLEAREVIPLLYENPEVLLLGFRDPSFEVPKVIRDVFPAKREITGTPREALTKLLTQREAKAINSESFDPFSLYKYVSGLNPVRCRRLFSDFANRIEATSGRPREQEIYAELRKQTVSDGVELPNVKLDTDIGGYTEVKTRLKEELIDLLVRKDTLTDPADVAQMESLLPRGMIFHGPPGTGKTYFAKAIATAINATVHVVSGPELKSKWVGEAEENLRRIFRVARQSAPSVVIFDEIDSFAHQRGSYSGSGVEHSMVNQLLTEMDGFRKNEMVFVVATTNFLESLDGALMRPGRFEFMIEIPAPSAEDREAIIRIYDSRFGLKLSDDVIKHLVRRTEGLADREKGLPFAGDHIQAVARALKRQQLRSGKLEVTTDDIDKALQRKTRRPIVLSAEEEKVIATHEAGHALLAMLIPNATLPERITIASDMDGALGYVQRAARSKPYALTGKDLRAEICVALGGNVAEKLAFGETSVGAANDLRVANAIARSMVENYGMTEGLGMCVVGDPKEPVSQHLSEQRDREVSAILKSEYARATITLTKNRPMLDALVALLLERKTLDATALKSLKPEA